MRDHLFMNDEQFGTCCEQEAILTTMGATNLPLEEQRKKIMLADIFDLNVVAIFDKHNKGCDLLGHSTSISDSFIAQSSQGNVGFTIKAAAPGKRTHSEMDIDLKQPPPTSLYHLLRLTHLIISTSDYTEMNDEIANILNID
ncbi:unnamed protein product [Rhizopus stolonifer]